MMNASDVFNRFNLHVSQEVAKVALQIVVAAIASLVISSHAVGVDWVVFHSVSRSFVDPYSSNPYFINLPWVLPILLPFSVLGWKLSFAINTFLNIMVFGALISRRGGNTASILLAFTSPPFIFLLSTGSIEWIPALAFLLPPSLGLVLLSVKPQTGGLMALEWILNRRKNLTKTILPSFLVVVLSFVVWGWWPKDLLSNIAFVQSAGMDNWNMSLFPWLIPVGILISGYTLVKKPMESEFLLSVATLCLVPYFTMHSIVLSASFAFARFKRWRIAIWILMWVVWSISTFTRWS